MAPQEIRRFEHVLVGRAVHIYEALPSTNDLAATLAVDPEQNGTIIVARHQTSGRGQYGRVWQSRPGDSLLLSVILHPPELLRRPVILTAWAAVSIGEAIRELTGIQAKLKWPNDLLLHGKKVCGILIEQAVTRSRMRSVVGMGLNLKQSASDFQDAQLPHATSLQLQSGQDMNWDIALQVVVEQLDSEYQRLIQGESVPLEADWKWRIGLLGRVVSVECTDGAQYQGRLRDITFDGIELEQHGTHQYITPERIRHIYAVDE